MEILGIDELTELPQVQSRVQTLRTAHHTMAQLLAKGLKDTEVARLVNRSPPTVRNFRLVPANQELIASYAQDENEELLDEVEYRLTLRRRSGTLALERLVDDLEAGVEMSHRTLLAITDSTDDRTGIGKVEAKLNINVDLKSKMIEAEKRLEGLEEARAAGKVVDFVRRL